MAKPKARKAGRPKLGAKGNVREELIQAGVRLAKDSSVEGLSLRKVAAEAGVSHVAAYSYFTDKGELLAAIAEQGLGEFFALYEDEVARTGEDFVNRFWALGWAYVHFVTNNQQYGRLLFGGSVLNVQDYPRLMAISRRTYRTLYRIMKMGQSIGAVAPGDTRGKTLTSWAMIHGVAMLLAEGRFGPKRDETATKELIQSITTYVYTGIQGPKPVAMGEQIRLPQN